MSGGRWLTHENQTGRKTEIWKWLTYKNIGQRTCHIDGSGSSEDFSLLGVEESIDHSEIHFMLCHVTWVLCRWWRGPYSVFLVSGQWGREFLILCCGNAAASAATHWQFHDSSSLPFICRNSFWLSFRSWQKKSDHWQMFSEKCNFICYWSVMDTKMQFLKGFFSSLGSRKKTCVHKNQIKKKNTIYMRCIACTQTAWGFQTLRF